VAYRLSGGPVMIDVDLIRRALAEDLAGGTDITSVATVSGNENVVADFTARKSGVIAGIEMAIERTALNFLGHLGGIATLTNRWVQEVAGTKTRIRDTRKTTPGMRLLEKAAVVAGGGSNHRLSLSDAALIKDNHIAAAGGVVQAFSKVRSAFPDAFIEIEVDSISQLEEVAAQSPDLLLLDNMSPQECASAVTFVAGRFKLEASGGITLENAKAYAESGVDYLAIGALTHSAPVLDIGLDLRLETRTEK
jgi:nicotinate-nucleotide pyrophosphorylase (carboxylating)